MILEQDPKIKVTHEAENGYQAIDIHREAFDRLHYDGCKNAAHERN